MPPLSEIAEHAQLGFLFDAHGLEAGIIKAVEMGACTHVFLIVDYRVYETDGSWMRSQFSDIQKYDNQTVKVFSIDGWTSENERKLINFCNKTKGEFYSYAACAVQGFFFWLNPKLKNWIDGFFDNSRFAKCDKLSRMGLFAATGDDFWRDCDASNPQELFDLVKMRKGLTQII